MKPNIYDFSLIKDQDAVPSHLKDKKLPIVEARTDMMVEVRKAHREQGIKFDPHHCDVALAFLSSRQSIDYIFVGSGSNAYAHFKGDEEVIHFTVKGREAWSRDNFDQKGKRMENGMLVVLHRSAVSDRLSVIREYGKKRKEELRKGAKKKPTPKKVRTRKFVFGISHRVRAPVVSALKGNKSNDQVSLATKRAEGVHG